MGDRDVEKEESNLHLSRMSTQWTLVFEAHSDRSDAAAAAQEALLHRYAGAIHRYLLAALRDPEAAADLSQEFALRFLRGDFHRADPSRGRFRDFLKRSLRNLMLNHLKRERREPSPLVSEPGVTDSLDQQFTESWRKELLTRAWAALADLEVQTRQPYFTILRCRVDHPDLRSPELAALLSERLGRPLSAVAVRRALQRARDRFVRYLVDEVSASLPDPSLDEIERELGELDLLSQCRPALRRLTAHPTAKDNPTAT